MPPLVVEEPLVVGLVPAQGLEDDPLRLPLSRPRRGPVQLPRVAPPALREVPDADVLLITGEARVDLVEEIAVDGVTSER